MKELVKRIEELEALLKAALTRIEELEAQHRQTSNNSSKPPSSDMGRRKVPKAATGRKAGFTPGYYQDPRIKAILAMAPWSPCHLGSQCCDSADTAHDRFQ